MSSSWSETTTGADDHNFAIWPELQPHTAFPNPQQPQASLIYGRRSLIRCFFSVLAYEACIYVKRLRDCCTAA